jgi:hypothetical protein
MSYNLPSGSPVWRGLLMGLFALLLVHPASAAEGAYSDVTAPSLNVGDEIPAPTEPVVLTVRGNIGARQNGEPVIEFDMPTLERLGVVRFTTQTDWTDAPVTFDGVLLSKLLDVVKADPDAEKLTMTALNDYRMDVPAADARTWPVMLALKADGQRMSVRDRGPIWVVYPQHAYPELNNREYLSRWVWQLASIEVQ